MDLLVKATNERVADAATSVMRLKVDWALHKSSRGIVLKGTMAGRDVVVKVGKIQEGVLDLHQRETEYLEMCRKCPHVCSVVISARIHSYGFLVTKYARYGSLGDYLASQELDDVTRMIFARQIAEGLAFLHMKGIAHRDVKPDNVFVKDERRVVIGDLGFATWIGKDNLEEVSRLCGSPDFMPPEMVRAILDGKGDFSSDRNLWPWDPMQHDAWALGCLFVELSGHDLSHLVGHDTKQTRDRYETQFAIQTRALFLGDFHPEGAVLHDVILLLASPRSLRGTPGDALSFLPILSGLSRSEPLLPIAGIPKEEEGDPLSKSVGAGPA